MVDADDSGEVSKRELVATIERLARLVQYQLTATDMGAIGYLWAVMDIDNEGELNYNQARQILKHLGVTHNIKEYGQKKM